MKKRLAGYMAALAVLISAVSAWGGASPVVLTHTLTGYSKGDRDVTLEYIVQVQNPGNSSLGPLSLTLVPHPPFIKKKTKVTVDKLAPNATANLGVKVVTSLLLDRDYFSKKPLFWAGRYIAADGKVGEFPVKSRPGGAK